jgi:hypothetical protein
LEKVQPSVAVEGNAIFVNIDTYEFLKHLLYKETFPETLSGETLIVILFTRPSRVKGQRNWFWPMHTSHFRVIAICHSRRL